ncbi:hypothetical protein [Virgibacillus necropolis]|uniref:Transporter n=1 Tax=Virgibacillus necropolis TaxID=163877 RepID=A0A221M7B7_9BACI|nr:hypothetical protein [Virgibacillus necropolis]ASN03533.1 hypothetical protein CFK40_00095 [Virgibacillus necropolis]
MNYNKRPNDNERQFNLPDFFPGFPGGGQPGGVPGGGQTGFPSPSGGQSVGAPSTPPPSFTPTQQQFQTYAVDPGAIQGCLYRFTYVWLYRDSFWFFPVFVGRRSISGFRWSGYRWVYYGVDLDRVQSFQCY